MLSDVQISHALRWHGLGIEPFDRSHLQAASYDVTLHPELFVQRRGGVFDPKIDTSDEWEWERIPEDGWNLMPGKFVLGSTAETFVLPANMVAQLEGKSSLGRLGLMVHSTAGFIDPGFNGQVTLELSCVGSRGVLLYPGMPIGQVAFTRTGPVGRPYAGKYNGQQGPTLSRYHQNWTGETWL